MSEITFHTNKGDIKIKLNNKDAPITSANFLAYAKDNFFTGTIFHRVIPGFVIQGGGMEAGMKEKANKAPIENEGANGLKNLKGSLSMARTSDPHSATSQFFINLVDNAFLDHKSKSPDGWGYAVFGDVIEGIDVVEAIAKTKTSSHGHHQDVPVEDILVTKTTCVE